MSKLILRKQDENRSCSLNTLKNIKRFKDILNLDQISQLQINSITSTNVMYMNSNTECTQFDLNVSLPSNFNVTLKISYPRTTLFSNEVVEIRKLRIDIHDDEVKPEIISCINYLQRQCNAHLALSILKKCAVLIAERRLIMEMLSLHCEGLVEYKFHEDGGIMLTCIDRITNFKFFESLWKLQFECSTHTVTDYVDFSVTTHDTRFYESVKPIMDIIIKPNLSYQYKVELWWNIIREVNTSIHRDFLRTRANAYMRVTSTSSDLVKYEIIETDDEDCIIIDDD